MKHTPLVNQETDYALRALLHLASADDERVTGAEVAEACAIPESYAYKLLKKAQRAELVESVAGRGGGFWLSRDPADLSLNEVVSAMQGPVEVRPCVLDPATCELAEDCPICEEWARAQERLVRFLKRITLADMLQGVRRRREPGWEFPIGGNRTEERDAAGD